LKIVTERKKIKSALVSVFHKDGLDRIIRKLNDLGVQLISTGGTAGFIKSLGVEVMEVESLTAYPSILGGRVKTLHPKVFGGILGRRDLEEDVEEMKEFDIEEIDLVIVDLYPFEETVAGGGTNEEIIEKIDIGGISLIRAAAKNHKDVLIVSSMEQYNELIEILDNEQGFTEHRDRLRFAAEAFAVSSNYDTSIYNYFAGHDREYLKLSKHSYRSLRYGENPHQKGRFYGDLNSLFEQIHGKVISYNNLLDIDAAIRLIDEFDTCSFGILKHNNACGLASRGKLVEAWKDALAGDPISAFGGILVTNRPIDHETAEEMNKIFFEVVIAPSYSDEALSVLRQKKNRIILIRKDAALPFHQHKSLLNGVIWQELDTRMEAKEDLNNVTVAKPDDDQISDLLFANILVKHTKSNAIVLVKNKQLAASGTGQTSRVDALKQAIEKAKNFGFDLNGAVMASDAFFPFKDSIEIAYSAGIRAVIQPGGSIRDQESIDYCNENKIPMVFTGIRHFKH
jgi:phosphoribosylaminoimidazolecarboxamide formyltransferase/IMP cyclohydrolase